MAASCGSWWQRQEAVELTLDTGSRSCLAQNLPYCCKRRLGTTDGASRGLGKSQAKLHFHQNLFTPRADEIRTRELSAAVGTRTEGFAPLHAAEEADGDRGCFWGQVQHHQPSCLWNHSLFLGQLKVQSQPLDRNVGEWPSSHLLQYVLIKNYSTVA